MTHNILEQNRNTTLYGATLAMILAGQKDAKKQVLLFFSVYILSGTTSESNMKIFLL